MLTYHNKTVTSPKFFPTTRAGGNLHTLTVHRDNSCRRFTNGAPRDIPSNLRSRNGRHHHRHRFCRRQPVTVVIPLCIVTHIIQITEHVRHHRELPQTTSWGSEILTVGFGVAHYVEQREAVPHLNGALGTHRDDLVLRVTGEEIASGAWAWLTWCIRSWEACGSWTSPLTD